MQEITSFSYFGRAFKDPFGIADQLVRMAKVYDVEFTSIVVTGVSGGSIAPLLAAALDVKFAIIRKESDNSHAMPCNDMPVFEGTITDRWLFVDDFIGTGATFRTVQRAVQIIAAKDRKSDFQCVGSFQYERDTFTPLRLAEPASLLSRSTRKCSCGCGTDIDALPAFQ